MSDECLSGGVEVRPRRWHSAARFGLVVAAACAGCATTSADFRMSSVGSNDAAIAGRLTILYNGHPFNENCRATFGHQSIQLSQDGIVLLRLAKGWTALQRLDCKDTSNQHVQIHGAHLLARGDGWVSDFGDVAVTWVAAGGLKMSSMFGLIGAIVDESSDDGVATVAVHPPAAEVRAAFRRQTGVEGKWAVQQLSQPASGPDQPPPPSEPEEETPAGPHFFCLPPAPGHQGTAVCEREQASCERMRGAQPAQRAASCTPASTAWCYVGDARLRCFATQDACRVQRGQSQDALDDCGEQY